MEPLMPIVLHKPFVSNVFRSQSTSRAIFLPVFQKIFTFSIISLTRLATPMHSDTFCLRHKSLRQQHVISLYNAK